jgi:cephalosporin hydroxylase
MYRKNHGPLVAAFLVLSMAAFAVGKYSYRGDPNVAGPSMRSDADIVREFTVMYGDRWQVWQRTFWLGVPTQKNPMDMWNYQEILYETKPDLLIETGTFKGGSALYFASIFDLIGNGKVITVDIKPQPGRPVHPRVEYLIGSSVSPEIISQIRNAAQGARRVMVVLDSDHRKEHVLQELQTYAPLVTIGDYLVVEDTSINGNPTYPDFGPGPMEATEEFLKINTHFKRDLSRQKFGLTFNPGGWLRRDR